MNEKLGRIGAQEAVCLAAAGLCASGVFTPDSAMLYAGGNSAYITMLLSAALALCIFLFAGRAMRRLDCRSYGALLRLGFGGVFGGIFAVITALALVFSAAALFDRFLIMLGRYVFARAENGEILLYMAAAAFLLAFLGLEGLGRTARLFALPLIAALFLALFLAVHNCESYRLAPVLGDGLYGVFEKGAYGSLLFLPALLSLLAAARGLHGIKQMRRAGLIAAGIGGAVAALCQLFIGMTYPYNDLVEMQSPMYRLTSDFKTSSYFPELDTLLLFGWLMMAVLAAAFYLYAASLLYMEAFGQGDVRPALAVFAACAAGLALVWREPRMAAILDWARRLIVLPLAALPAAAAVLARVRGHMERKREGRNDEPV